MKISTPTYSNLISGLFIIVLSFSLFETVAWGSDGFSGSILVLPFHVTASSDETKLQEFSEHAYRTLRTDIKPADSNLRIESQEATDALLQNKSLPTNRNEAIELAEKAGVRLVVFGFLSQEGPNYRLKGEMWDLKKKKTAVSTDVKVTNIFHLQRILRVFVGTVNKCIHGTPSLPFYHINPHTNQLSSTQKVRATREGPWRSPPLNANLRGLDIGDIDGDKRNEIVLVDESLVTINRFEKGVLKSLAQFSQRPAVYLSAEVEDLDGDGKSELIICYQTPRGLESEIFRYDAGSLRSLGKHTNIIMRAISDPFRENKLILVGQRTDVSEMFSGKMIRFRIDEKQITPVGTLDLPPGTLLLSYTSGKMGRDAQSLRIILNQDQRLMVFDLDNRLLYSNMERLFGLNRSVRLSNKVGPKTVSFPGRLLLVDTDGDGENELLTIKQTSQGSYIQDFTWDGVNLVAKWNSIESQGIITDFRVRDFKNDGTKSLVLLLVKHNPLLAFFGGPRSVVFAYDLAN